MTDSLKNQIRSQKGQIIVSNYRQLDLKELLSVHLNAKFGATTLYAFEETGELQMVFDCRALNKMTIKSRNTWMTCLLSCRALNSSPAWTQLLISTKSCCRFLTVSGHHAGITMCCLLASHAHLLHFNEQGLCAQQMWF